MNGSRRLDLDGLRGLAVLLVVGFHAGLPALRGAFVAVDVFFVLSGFFLATTLTRRLATGEEIRPAELVASRVWRLLPALVVVLLGTLATTLLYAPIDRAAVAARVVPVAAFVPNLAFAADGVNYFAAGQNPLLHTWTLGVELQLALLFPLLVMLCAAWGGVRAGTETGAERRWIVLRTVLIGVAVAGLLSFVLSVNINDSAPMWAYFGPHTRLWSFCAGGLMAFLTGGGQSALGGSARRIGAVQVAGLGLLVVPSLLYERTLEYPGVMALAPVGGTLCLLATGGLATVSLPGRLLACRPLVALGAVSYAWYLWHLPLMVLGAVLTPDIGPGGRLAWGFAGLAAAMLTHRLLAHPASAALLTRARGGRPLLAAAGVSAALALLGVGAAWSSARHVEQSVHRRYAAARNDHLGHDCWGSSPRDAAREGCAFGDAGSATTIALLGDSHASHWLGGLERAGQAHGWRIEPYIMGACPVADLRGLIAGAAGRLYNRCARFQEANMRRLAAARPRAVILSNADYYMEAEPGQALRLPESVWTEGLRRTYARLDRMGIEALVIRDVPWVPFDVPSCLSRRAARLPRATDCRFAPDQAFIARARRAQDRAARGLRVGFIDMNGQVCGASSARCGTERDRMV
ncbi:MAG TPA: acyltransferase family protein, partial [Gemmatimonadales bacterium]|nr:acyltransferase family protein [Gemmatimonadales bacterium]